MTSIRALTGKQIVIALVHLGFKIVRIRGSHHYLRHPDGRATIVPVHDGETISLGLVARILRDTKIPREQLYAAL